jgi:hypothetical protein
LFCSIISGKVDGTRLLDVSDTVEKEIDDIEASILAKKLLVKVQVGLDDHSSMWCFNAWAIISSDTPLEHLLAARESINGTLVLAVYKWDEKGKQTEEFSTSTKTSRKIGRELAKSAQIVAYLNTSHQDNGTYLIKADDQGVLDVVFRTVDTPQPEVFSMPESMEDGFGGLDFIAGLSDAVTDVKISLSERVLSLASCDEKTTHD